MVYIQIVGIVLMLGVVFGLTSGEEKNDRY